MMENFEANELTNDVQSLAKLNKYNQNYTAYSGAPLQTKAISEDFELLKKYTGKYQKRYTNDKPCLGDCLRLPDGQTVYFCHIHGTYAQTCGGGSFRLTSNGGISYSGSLDSGITFNEIELTTEKYVLPVWFSHLGYLTGGSAIYARIECRIWKTKVGADLSGIAQVRRLKRQTLKEQSETLAKVDGNGRTYQQHLPEIMIKKNNLPEELLKEVEHATGLKFEDSHYYVPVYWCQPMKRAQIETLRKFTQFNISEEHDYSTYSPLIMLSYKYSGQ
jgi:hypothetical protein